jgi:hypothetical protein
MVEQATQRVGPLRKNLQTHHEVKRGAKDRGGQRPLYVKKKKRETVINVGGWNSGQLSPLRKKMTTTDIRKGSPRERTLLGSRGTLRKILYEIYDPKKH